MSSGDAKHRLSDWFRQWRLPLRRFLGKAGVSPADIDDIAQEVFLRVMRYDRTNLIDHPQAYLFRRRLEKKSNVHSTRSVRISARS